MRFRVMLRERSLLVEVDQHQARYSLRKGEELEIEHHGETITVDGDGPVERPIPHLRVPSVRLRQPPGREPARRRPPPTN
jgi:alpha,alpha-trehalose phosphorylase